MEPYGTVAAENRDADVVIDTASNEIITCEIVSRPCTEAVSDFGDNRVIDFKMQRKDAVAVGRQCRSQDLGVFSRNCVFISVPDNAVARSSVGVAIRGVTYGEMECCQRVAAVGIQGDGTILWP